MCTGVTHNYYNGIRLRYTSYQSGWTSEVPLEWWKVGSSMFTETLASSGERCVYWVYWVGVRIEIPLLCWLHMDDIIRPEITIETGINTFPTPVITVGRINFLLVGLKLIENVLRDYIRLLAIRFRNGVRWDKHVSISFLWRVNLLPVREAGSSQTPHFLAFVNWFSFPRTLPTTYRGWKKLCFFNKTNWFLAKLIGFVLQLCKIFKLISAILLIFENLQYGYISSVSVYRI